ncbi:hypothetical protein [Ochrobactrum intermedium]|uniref:hypothetical protein n=1 Tax=Brucella intermedia TaxID=94625 RepID=UPI0009464983
MLVDGREELVEEIAVATPEDRAYIAGQISVRLKHSSFEHFLEANVRGLQAQYTSSASVRLQTSC